MTPRGARQLRVFVVRPTLQALGLWSPAAENLVLGTGAQESGLDLINEVTGPSDLRLGPGIGFFQVELATHDDIWANWLHYRAELAGKVAALLAPSPERGAQLASNLAYAAAICRLRYARVTEPLPDAGDVDALGFYWKAHYNTAAGAGTAAEFAANYRRLCGL
jgi:hypothetical protein